MRLTLFAALLATAAPAFAAPDYQAAIERDYDTSLGALFQHFHQNPELSFKEVKTAARMATELRAVPGVVVTERVGGTGVVGVMANGPGPVVLLRADMDALPIEEKSGLPYASKVRQVGIDGVEAPVMHACGHDTHITGLVATAKALARLRDRWSGTVLFVVQPAEERSGGAKAMIADGLYTRFPKAQYAIGWHVNAGMPTGTVAGSEGIAYSSVDSVDITVRGIGTHGAVPNAGKDPIYMGAQLVVALQGLISRERPPLAPGVITVGAFHSGTKHNIISDEAKLQLTVRANDEKTRAELLAGIRRVAEGVGRLNGLAEDKLPVVTATDPTLVTLNDGPLARRLNTVIAAAMGPATVVPFEQMGMGGEDFSQYGQPEHKVAAVIYQVGGTPKAELDAARAGRGTVAAHHSPLFKVDPRGSIVTGATAMTAAVLDLAAKR